jgi:hypothetical protein
MSANLSALFANGRADRYDLRVGKTVYKIEEFPDDDRLWRIEWIGGVRYNSSVPSDPLMDVCLTRLPTGETNPLSARSRFSEAKSVAKIGVGLLPFISIASVWQKGRPVATNCAAYRRQLTIDTKLCRTEMLGDLTANYNGIPRRLKPNCANCSNAVTKAAPENAPTFDPPISASS